MSRRTITLTAPNGAKVRTVHSKRYFVVAFGPARFTPDSEPVETAKVIKRTDSAIAAFAALRKHGHGSVVFAVSNDGEFKNQLTYGGIATRAETEKQNKNFVDRTGNNGPARSLSY